MDPPVTHDELRAMIAEHPWQAVGVAALLGAAYGVIATPRGKLGELFAATFGVIATRLLRDRVTRVLADSARRWRESPARA
jgi:hypothetical protein